MAKKKKCYLTTQKLKKINRLSEDSIQLNGLLIMIVLNKKVCQN